MPISSKSASKASDAAQSLRIGPQKIFPPILQAPMAGFTNFAYRALTHRLGGVGLAATEMVSARSFVEKNARDEGPPERLWGVREEPRPLAVQIWDNHPDTLARVAEQLAHDYRVSIVDLNFGCPVRRVSEKAESGSYLLQDPDRVGRIVERVAQACCDTPVTAKIRLGWTRDSINAADVAQAVEGAGGAALTVHGRTAQDLYRGTANWEAIAAIRPYLKAIPLIGNGDLRTAEEAAEAFRRYDVDGVMIGRAGLGRPWIFRQTAQALAGDDISPDPSPEQQQRLLLDLFDMLIERFGPRKATVLMRKYACCYAHGKPGARAFRGNVSQALEEPALRAMIQRQFPGVK